MREPGILLLPDLRGGLQGGREIFYSRAVV